MVFTLHRDKRHFLLFYDAKIPSGIPSSAPGMARTTRFQDGRMGCRSAPTGHSARHALEDVNRITKNIAVTIRCPVSVCDLL